MLTLMIKLDDCQKKIGQMSYNLHNNGGHLRFKVLFFPGVLPSIRKYFSYILFTKNMAKHLNVKIT